MQPISIKLSPFYDEVLDFLLSSPTPTEIIEFRPTETTQQEVNRLLEANREGMITEPERAVLEEFSQIEHWVRMLKLRAHQKLSSLNQVS